MVDDEDVITVSAVDDHPWGGTVVQSNITEPVYVEVIKSRIGDIYLDMGNALAVHLLDVVSNRIKSSATNVREADFSRLLTSDDEVLFDYYMANTLSLSLFEAAMFLALSEPLCYQDSEFADDLLHYFDEERGRRKVTKESGEVNKRLKIVEVLAEDYDTGDYLHFVENEFDSHLDLDDALLEAVREVRDERGSIVHNFTYLYSKGREIPAKDNMAECWALAEFTQQFLRRNLQIHDGIFKSLGSD